MDKRNKKVKVQRQMEMPNGVASLEIATIFV